MSSRLSLVRPPSPGPIPEPFVGYLSRKALPIKRNDAEPLTREDVQYDMLNYIFSDTLSVFTNQSPGKTDKVTFCELYLNALYNSSKCSKVLKDKMVESPEFALELSKISLLVNIGRINTTMAFFPEMKTALRTYHPIPSLQKSDGNAQDAPRIKNCLKAALLPSEFKSVPPSSPEEIIERSQANVRPPTSIVNLIFVLANHAAPLAGQHFDGQFNFLDLFLPRKLSSEDRARVFLWLMFRYLEGPHIPNPFDDDHSRNSRGKAPKMRNLTDEEMEDENRDTPEEVEWGERKSQERVEFLGRLVAHEIEKRRSKSDVPQFIPARPEPDPSASRPRHYQSPTEDSADGNSFLFYVPPENEGVGDHTASRRRYHNGGTYDVEGERQTMLEHAWFDVLVKDPLADSDEEPDEDTRLDYAKRLNTISRLRGRPPTPDNAPAMPKDVVSQSTQPPAGWTKATA